MRKLVLIMLTLALAAGLTACSRAGDPFIPQFAGETVAVRRQNVLQSRTVTHENFLQMLERVPNNQPVSRSFVVQRQQVFRDHFSRVVYYAYPNFSTGELENPARRQINRYYRARQRANTALRDFEWLRGLDEITDTTDQVLRYRLQVYAVELLDDFVAVRFRRDSHTGGGMIDTTLLGDVFCRHTGDKLTLTDIIDVQARAAEINLAVADHLRVRDTHAFASFDVLTWENLQYTLVPQGIVLLISPGELAPRTAGAIEVTIPW
ncbi:MAG: RsiV family protein [Oscillospiraceae bacterium]|nr:RsiV family protein [Oscillospiraceae bacterium]